MTDYCAKPYTTVFHYFCLSCHIYLLVQCK